MPDGAGYEEDLVLWSFEQARRLRAVGASRSNWNLDWENLAEEIESLGQSNRREVESRLDTIYEHLLKLQCSPAPDPRRGWMTTIRRERSAVRRLLRDSPSLVRTVDVWTATESADVVRRTSSDLRDYGENEAADAVELIVGDSLARRVLEEDFFPHPHPRPPGPVTSK